MRVCLSTTRYSHTGSTCIHKIGFGVCLSVCVCLSVVCVCVLPALTLHSDRGTTAPVLPYLYPATAGTAPIPGSNRPVREVYVCIYVYICVCRCEHVYICVSEYVHECIYMYIHVRG